MYSIETVARVWDDDEAAFMEIGPDSDGLGCVEIRTTDEKSIMHFGHIGLRLDPESAVLVAKAILKICEEMKNAKLPK